MDNLFRDAAIARIVSTPELNSINYLVDVDWQNADYLWQWIASAPLEEVISKIEYLSWKSIERSSIHEAGHALAAVVTGLTIIKATAVPNFETKYVGRTDAANFFDDMPNVCFPVWRTLVTCIAGPIAEIIWTRTTSTEMIDDGNQVNLLLNNKINPSLHQNWCKYMILSAYQIVNNSKNWNTILEISRALLKHGTIDQEAILMIVKSTNSTMDAMPIVNSNIRKMLKGFVPCIPDFITSGVVKNGARQWSNHIFESEMGKMMKMDIDTTLLNIWRLLMPSEMP
jgi:hypothetical protein